MKNLDLYLAAGGCLGAFIRAVLMTDRGDTSWPLWGKKALGDVLVGGLTVVAAVALKIVPDELIKAMTANTQTAVALAAVVGYFGIDLLGKVSNRFTDVKGRLTGTKGGRSMRCFILVVASLFALLAVGLPVSAQDAQLIQTGQQLKALLADASNDPPVMIERTVQVQSPQIIRVATAPSGAADPLDDLVNDIARTHRAVAKIRLFQSVTDALVPSAPPVQPRRSVFGLTPAGGAQGAVMGATVGGLLCHLGVFDPTAVTLGSCLILGAIFGQ